MSKGSPIITPWYYDTKEGIDHLTKTLDDETDIKSEDTKILNKEMKLGAYQNHAKALKQFDRMDKSTYPSEPKNRGILLEMKKLEEDLNPQLFENTTNNLNKDKKKKEKSNLAQQIIKDTLETYSKGFERMNVKKEEIRLTPRFRDDQMEPPFAYNKPQPKYGLHEAFVNNKLYEGEIVKKVNKEVDDEKI